jgi:small-conductance mechanosensitive channel
MKLKILVSMIIIFFFCFIIDLSYSQKTKEIPEEKIENSVDTHHSITDIHSFLNSPGGIIFESILGIVLFYFLLHIIFKKIIMKVFLSNNLQRYVPILKIMYWLTAICFISLLVLKPTTQTIIIIGIFFFAAIGFVSQDFLKNIFAGILILFDKQIQVGDTIQIGNYIGEIYQIGLKNIKLVTPEKLQVSIPNSEFVKQTKSITDSRESYAQVTTEIYLPAKIDMVKVKMIAERAALTSRYIYLNKPIEIVIKNEIHQNQSVIMLVIVGYIFNKQYESKFSSELTEIILDELTKQKITSPFELSFN